MRFDSFPDINLFGFWGHDFTLLRLILIVLVFAAAIIINRLIKDFFRSYCRKKKIKVRIERFLRTGLKLILLTVSIVIVFNILDFDIQTLLNYTVYSNEKISIEVYNLILLGVSLYFINVIVYLIEFLVERRISRKRLDKGRGRSFFLIVKYLIWVIGIIVIISTIGVKVTLVIASISALLVGAGFGLQHIFNDLFSGIIILFDGSIEVDDVVEVEGTVGRVLAIGLRVSKLLARDNVVIIIPNSRFTGENVINWSHNEEVTRFHVNVGVAYGSDVRLVESILKKCAEHHPQIVDEPKPFVRFNDFGDSSLDFQLLFWTSNDFGVENIKSDLRFDIDKQFRVNKIEIPFPQRDLHLKSRDFGE